ncbi:MAG TPA: alginate export family protein [Fimbriimonadaceae bacterium]|nr:alginate export family protein [Fimbriimonadaceae bacterium]
MPFVFLPDVSPLNVHIYAEDRQRFERRVNKDFDSTTNDNRSDLYSRFRVGATFKYGKNWKGQVEYENASDVIWTAARNYSTWNSNLSLAYVETADNGWTVDLGRQRINVGSIRLICSCEWSNVTTTFDGLRLRSKDWDIFGGKIGMKSTPAWNARLAYADHLSKTYGDTLYIFKHDDGIDIHTFDHTFTRSFGPVAFEVEGALQTGHESGKTQRAWAFHAKAAYNDKSGLKPYIEVNSASGGSSATENRTFDTNYGGAHGKYGIADMFCWKNMNQLGIGVDYTGIKNLCLHTSWNAYSLRDGRDAWYMSSGAAGASGSTKLQDPTGTSGRDLGQEINFDSTYCFSKCDSVQAGFAIFNPGKFVGNLTGHRDHEFWGYFQLNFKF